MTFGQLLRQYRTAAGFSQEHLAALARISVESVGALERGTRRAPYRETVALLADALELEAQDRAKLEAAANAGRARTRRDAGAPSEPVPTSRLPLQSTSFIGRTRDLSEIGRLLDANRLVTITGSGGVGKTRAAIEVASLFAKARGRSVCFVDLSPIGESRYLVGTIAKCLGITLPGTADSVESLVAEMQLRSVLVILDNCEHLIAKIALFVSASLRSCPDVSYLTTSRERLAVSGEVVYRLPSLDMPNRPPATVAEARRYAALELFIQRVAMLEPFFEFTDAGVRTTFEICLTLGGIPLAIELAAARVPTLGLEAVRDRLRRGSTLAGGARNLPARQQTMLATIEWSYNLLSDLEKTLLERVSIFVGGFTLAAAEAVCAGEGIASEAVSELLSSLVNKSLLSIAHREGRARYSILDSVKTFAHERLVAGGSSEMLSLRHASWFARYAEWIDATRTGKSEPWLRAETGPELENVRTALRWAFASPSRERALIGARIVGGLRTIWLVSGRRYECLQWAETALAEIDEERDMDVAAPLMRAHVQAVAEGRLFRESAEKALRVFERTGDHVAMAMVHSQLASAYSIRGRLDEADAAISRSGEILAKLPRSMPYAAFLLIRWQLRLAGGHVEQALSDIAEGMAIVNSLGDNDAHVWRLFRAVVLFKMGQRSESLETAVAILAALLAKEETYTREIAMATITIAEFQLEIADVEGSFAAAREALVRTFQQDIDYFSVRAMHVAALAAAKHGETRVAAKLWRISEAHFDPEVGFFWRERDRVLVPDHHYRVALAELEKLRIEGLGLSLDVIIAEALEALSYP